MKMSNNWNKSGKKRSWKKSLAIYGLNQKEWPLLFSAIELDREA